MCLPPPHQPASTGGTGTCGGARRQALKGRRHQAQGARPPGAHFWNSVACMKQEYLSASPCLLANCLAISCGHAAGWQDGARGQGRGHAGRPKLEAPAATAGRTKSRQGSAVRHTNRLAPQIPEAAQAALLRRKTAV